MDVIGIMVIFSRIFFWTFFIVGFIVTRGRILTNLFVYWKCDRLLFAKSVYKFLFIYIVYSFLSVEWMLIEFNYLKDSRDELNHFGNMIMSVIFGLLLYFVLAKITENIHKKSGEKAINLKKETYSNLETLKKINTNQALSFEGGCDAFEKYFNFQSNKHEEKRKEHFYIVEQYKKEFSSINE